MKRNSNIPRASYWLIRSLMINLTVFYSVTSFANDFRPLAHTVIEKKLSPLAHDTEAKLVCNALANRVVYLADVSGGVTDAKTGEPLPGVNVVVKSTTISDDLSIAITGRVTDDSGAPLPGVNVFEKGTTNGAITDVNGYYTVSVTDQNSILVFSFIGFLSKEVIVGTQSSIDVVMMPDVRNLSEVIVVGYGEQSQKTLTTSITKVNGSLLSQQRISTVGEALAGLSPGVQVQSGRGGYPGEAPIIRIRGIGSLGTTSAPLYVVDGYPLQSANNFNQINPADIESVEILKDAASAAIYGSRAANGVVIVTTKKGKAGKTRFDLSMYHGVQEVSKKIDLMNSEQYVKYAKDVLRITRRQAPDLFNQPEKWAHTDWQNAIFKTAPMKEYQLSASGGSDKVRFLVSGAYFSQDGVVRGTDYNRYTIRFNMDANLSKKLKIGLNMAPSFMQQYRMPTQGQFNNGEYGMPSIIHTALLTSPIIPERYSDGRYGQANGDPATAQYGFLPGGLYSPLAVQDLFKYRLRNFRILSSSFLEFEPMEGLRLKTTLGSTLDVDDEWMYIPPTMEWLGGPGASVTKPNLNGMSSTESQQRGFDRLWENSVTYSRTINHKHNLSGLVVYSIQKYNSKFTSVTGKSGTYSNLLIDNPTASSDLSGTVTYDLNSFESLVGRVTYDYDNKYLFSAAIRRDGSSRFGPNKRYANFPSVSAGWRVSEENFMTGLKSVVNELKLRASYGETGNANIGSFTWLSGMSLSNYSFGGTRASGFTQSGWSNRDLTWEKNKQTDVGIDAEFLKGKLSVTADYYKRTTQGFLFQKSLPGVVGYSSTFQTNLGEIENKGIELAVASNLEFGKLQWTIEGNFTAYKTNVNNLGGPQSLPAQPSIFGWNNVYQIKVGQPLGQMYGFVVEGIFKNAEDLAAHPQWASGNKVGDWIIKDTNGRDAGGNLTGVPDGKINTDDMTLLGQGFPTALYGLTNTLRYKGFDLSLIVQGLSGGNIINGNLRHTVGGGGNVNAPSFYIDNYFDPAAPDRTVKYHAPGATGVTAGGYLTNLTLYDASFLRIRNVSFGYSFPKTILDKAKLNSARLYISGQNLYTFSNYFGYNPESSVTGDSVYQPGIDQGAYPLSRTFTIGVNIGF